MSPSGLPGSCDRNHIRWHGGNGGKEAGLGRCVHGLALRANHRLAKHARHSLPRFHAECSQQNSVESNRSLAPMIRLDSARARTKSAGLSLSVKGRQPVTNSWRERGAVLAGRGFVLSALGRHRASSCRHNDRRARCSLYGDSRSFVFPARVTPVEQRKVSAPRLGRPYRTERSGLLPRSMA